MTGRPTYRCNGWRAGCPNAWNPDEQTRRGGMKAIEAAARQAGWGVWRGRLYGVEMMATFTCPECRRATPDPP